MRWSTRSIWVLAVFVLLASACSSNDSPLLDESALPDDGCMATESAEVATLATADGAEREYRVYLPEGASSETPVPLVFDFHGAGGSAAGQAALSEFEVLAAEQTFAVVTPEGTNQRWGPADVSFIDELLAEVTAGGCIDDDRVFAAGMSNGGFFASHLACVRSEVFLAIGSVTGFSHQEPCEPTAATSIIHFHGVIDEVVDFDPIPAEVGEWAQTLGCESEQASEVNDVIELFAYQGCDDQAKIAFYAIADAGHTWPGSERSAELPDWFGPTNFDIDATVLIWEFFQAAS